MRLIVELGPRASGKTTRLREAAAKYGVELHDVHPANLFSVYELRRVVTEAVARGDTHVYFDDCSTAQIGVLMLAGDSTQSDLTIHVTKAV